MHIKITLTYSSYIFRIQRETADNRIPVGKIQGNNIKTNFT